MKEFSTRAATAAFLIVGLIASSYVQPGSGHFHDQNIVEKQLLPSDDSKSQGQQLQLRRRLQDEEQPQMSEAEIIQQQMRSYLGGLSPAVDRFMVPVHLRDTLDTDDHIIMDLYNPSGQALARNNDQVFFWHIPKSCGKTMKMLMLECFGLRYAEKDKPNANHKLEYAKPGVVQIDTNSPEGLQFAFENQLVNSGMVDAIVSSYFLSGAALFNEEHRGRTFTILRHPVDLALGLFNKRRRGSKEWQELSFADYVNSTFYMDSWMTRQLTGTMPWVHLDESHLEQAKNVMARKIFVGVADQMGETMRQLRMHFGWKELSYGCVGLSTQDFVPKAAFKGLQGGRGGAVWTMLMEKERWDMTLYHFGLEMFARQHERFLPPGEQPPPDQQQPDAQAY